MEVYHRDHVRARYFINGLARIFDVCIALWQTNVPAVVDDPVSALFSSAGIDDWPRQNGYSDRTSERKCLNASREWWQVREFQCHDVLWPGSFFHHRTLMHCSYRKLETQRAKACQNHSGMLGMEITICSLALVCCKASRRTATCMRTTIFGWTKEGWHSVPVESNRRQFHRQDRLTPEQVSTRPVIVK